MITVEQLGAGLDRQLLQTNGNLLPISLNTLTKLSKLRGLRPSLAKSIPAPIRTELGHSTGGRRCQVELLGVAWVGSKGVGGRPSFFVVF